ncbi:hypothetical protein [Evansella clarkii]|uniref:hypothetical protein n=1 Tax=Evansella clarkii TaxID=79879 RepID=UPI00099669C6|nr:hypothetical protein [Evansella clarkii]
MKWEIHDALKADPVIDEHVKNPIKFYEYPPTESMSGVYIVIDSLDVPIPEDYADNKPLSDSYLYQIEVWSKDSLLTEKVAKRVRKVLLTLGFGQGAGVDEWDKDTGVFRDARRYEGKAYDSEII